MGITSLILWLKPNYLLILYFNIQRIWRVEKGIDKFFFFEDLTQPQLVKLWWIDNNSLWLLSLSSAISDFDPLPFVQNCNWCSSIHVPPNQPLSFRHINLDSHSRIPSIAPSTFLIYTPPFWFKDSFVFAVGPMPNFSNTFKHISSSCTCQLLCRWIIISHI